jgi:hypothetical protein
MKLKIIFFSALLLAGVAKLNAQTVQHDSIRVHIIENKNGNMFDLDTTIAASQHDNLKLWLSSQGIELAGLPEGHDSAQIVLVNVEGSGDSLPDGMRIIELPSPPDAPLPPPAPGQKMRVMTVPPPPPAPPGTEGKVCRMVIICDTVVRCDNMKTKTNNSSAQQKVMVKNAPDGKALNVFPNPTSGHITIEIAVPGNEKADLTITDMNGKIIYTEQLGTATEKLTKEIDLSKFGKGMYNVEVHKGDNVFVKRITVE